MLNLDGNLMKRLGPLLADYPSQFRHDLACDGFTIIEPDGKTFRSFNLRNWYMASFLARRGGTVYVALIHAMRPQHGALTKLVRDIEVKAKLEMAVVFPLDDMQTILQRWLYAPRRELICGHIAEVWRAIER